MIATIAGRAGNAGLAEIDRRQMPAERLVRHRAGDSGPTVRCRSFALNQADEWKLRTLRTLVRPAVIADVPALHASRGQMPFDPQTRTLAQTRGLIVAMDRRVARDAAGWQQFAVVALENNVFLGDIGVNFDTPRNRQAEIGFAFAPPARGHGYALEAVGAMVAHLFARGRHRLIAQTDIRNVATQRLLERLRFRREGLYRQSWHENGQWFDEIAFARLADE